MQGQGPVDHRHLVAPDRVLDAGAPAGDRRHRLAGEDCGQGRGGGGVADAHVPGGQGVHPGGGGLFRHFHPHQEGLKGLIPGEGRFLGHIAGAVGHLPVDEFGDVAEIVVDPDIHHRHPGPGMPGQGIDPGAPPEKVEDHLVGDFLGIGAHPFGHHPMIRGEDHHPLFSRGWAATPRGCRHRESPVPPGGPNCPGAW